MAFRHVDAVKMTGKRSNWALEWGRKGIQLTLNVVPEMNARAAGWSIVWNCWSTEIFGLQRTVQKREDIQWAAFSGWKCLGDARGQTFLKATVTQMATCYIKAVQKNISEYTGHQILKQMSFSSRRPHRVPLLSPKNKKPWLEFTQKQQNWKIQDWKNIVWFDKSWFLLQHSDGSIRIWRQSGM